MMFSIKNEAENLFNISKGVGLLEGPMFSWGRIRGYSHPRYENCVSGVFMQSVLLASSVKKCTLKSTRKFKDICR